MDVMEELANLLFATTLPVLLQQSHFTGGSYTVTALLVVILSFLLELVMRSTDLKRPVVIILLELLQRSGI